jgi:integrase
VAPGRRCPRARRSRGRCVGGTTRRAARRGSGRNVSWGGLRVGEALALTPEKVDFERKTILVSAQLGGTTKRDTDRSVDVATPLVPVLREKLARRNTPASGKVVAPRRERPSTIRPGPNRAPALAETDSEGRGALLQGRAADHDARPEAAGLRGHFTPHSLRHHSDCCSSPRVSHLHTSSSRWGHASIQMMVDVYGSWLPVRAAGAVDRLAAATSPEGDRMVSSEGSEARRAVSRQGMGGCYLTER